MSTSHEDIEHRLEIRPLLLDSELAQSRTEAECILEDLGKIDNYLGVERNLDHTLGYKISCLSNGLQSIYALPPIRDSYTNTIHDKWWLLKVDERQVNGHRHAIEFSGGEWRGSMWIPFPNTPANMILKFKAIVSASHAVPWHHLDRYLKEAQNLSADLISRYPYFSPRGILLKKGRLFYNKWELKGSVMLFPPGTTILRGDVRKKTEIAKDWWILRNVEGLYSCWLGDDEGWRII